MKRQQCLILGFPGQGEYKLRTRHKDQGWRCYDCINPNRQIENYVRLYFFRCRRVWPWNHYESRPDSIIVENAGSRPSNIRDHRGCLPCLWIAFSFWIDIPCKIFACTFPSTCLQINMAGRSHSAHVFKRPVPFLCCFDNNHLSDIYYW